MARPIRKPCTPASARKAAISLLLLLSVSSFLWGEIRFSVSSVALGTLRSGDSKAAEVTLTNAGSAPVRITLTSTCDCLLVDRESMELPPGGTDSFTLTYIANEGEGEIRKHVIVRTDDPSLPKGLLSVTGMVEDPRTGEARAIDGQAGEPTSDQTPASAEGGARTIPADYYYDPGCKSCRDFLANRVPESERKTGVSLDLTLHDIMQNEEYEALMEILGNRGIEPSAFPVLFIGDTVLFGEERIEAGLETAMESVRHALPVRPDSGTAGSGKNPADFTAGKPLLLAPVLAAGLIDGVNPCAFTTLVFLIAAMTLAGKRRREVAIIGVCFTASVFISYALIGIGMFAVLRRAEAVPVVSAVLRYALAAFLAVVAVLSVIDYVRIQRGKGERIFLQLPKSMKRAIHSSIRGTLRSTAVAGSSIVLGFLVSVFELGCTGQIYLPTIAYMVRTGSAGVSGWIALFVYNVGFILPLIGVFVVSYAGIGSEKIGDFFKRRLGSVKLATAILFVGLAVLTLVMK